MNESAPTLDDYRREVLERAREHGLEAARLNDVDGFDTACRAVRRAAHERDEFTTDDVEWPIRGNELGAAFRALSSTGEIRAVGFTTSRRPQSHGRVVRVWRAA